MMGRMKNCFNNFFRFTFFLGGPKSVIWPREMCRPQRLRDSFLSFCTLIALFFVVFSKFFYKKKHIQPGRVGKT